MWSPVELIATGSIVLALSAIAGTDLDQAGQQVMRQYGVTCQDQYANCAVDPTTGGFYVTEIPPSLSKAAMQP